MSAVEPLLGDQRNRAVTLPMYIGGDLDAANRALFARVRERLVSRGVSRVPAHLPTREVDVHDPDLLLGQVCGLPFVLRDHEALSIVATPHYDVPGADGPLHRSFLVTADRGNATWGVEHLRKRKLTLAVNAEHSNTGRSLLAELLLRTFGSVERIDARILLTGSHDRSMEHVETGRADLASIDCVTFFHLVRHDPQRRSYVKIVAASPAVPAPPFVTGRNTSPHELHLLRSALAGAIRDDSVAPALGALRIRGFSQLDERDYAPLLGLHARAEQVFSADSARRYVEIFDPTTGTILDNRIEP